MKTETVALKAPALDDLVADRPGTASPYSLLISVVAIAMALLHMTQIQFYWLPSGQFKNLHIGFSLCIVFLLFLEKCPPTHRFNRWMLAGMPLLTLLATFYIHTEYSAFVSSRAFLPSYVDTAIAVLLLVVVLAACWLQWDRMMPTLAVLTLLYGYFGYLMPGELFWHNGVTLQRLISYTSIPYFQGLLGSMTELSAGTIFIFMVFAEALRVAGGMDLIMSVSALTGRRSPAGPANMAIISSGLMGMISGSTVANVASSGVITIPLMKRFGFSADFAGAVESVSSNGGQITPPVMGLAAFMIVSLTGIPYSQVAAGAALPALIFYLYLLFSVHLWAVKRGIRPLGPAAPTEIDERKTTIAKAFVSSAHVIFGICILTYLLLDGMPSGFAALYSTLIIMASDIAKRLYVGRKDLRAAAREAAGKVKECLVQGSIAGAQIAIMVALCGILVDIIAITGFAHKLAFGMIDLADGNLIALLAIAAVACIVFGLGLPTSASYILVALLGAPALVQMGVPILAAHMYVLYFANASNLTPPVALACLVAANISGGSFMRTCLISMWLGLPGFLLPVIFVLHPELLGIGASVLEMVGKFILALFAIAAFNVVIEGYLLRPVSIAERILLVLSSFAIFYPGWVAASAGAALMLAVLARQFWHVRRTKPLATQPAT